MEHHVSERCRIVASKNVKINIFNVLIVAVLIFSGCQSDRMEGSSISGIAMLDEPVVGATVSIVDTDGKTVYREVNETHSTGSFLLSSPVELPGDFDIVVTGGTLGEGGPAVTETLRTEVRNHQREHYAFYLADPISSLVATFRRSKAGRTNEQAVAAVWEYLDLPSSADAVNDSYFITRHFHRGAFMQAARDAGGFQAYLNYLSAQIENPTDEPPCFSEKCDEMLTGAAGFIAGAVAKGALSYVGGEAAGYVMNKAFGWGEEPPDRQAEIIAMLSDQSEMLENVISELEHLQAEVAASRQAILAEIKNTKYDLKAANLINIRSFAESIYQQLYIITQTDPREEGYADMISELAKRMEDRDLQTDLAMIHNTLVSNAPGETGLFDIWGDIQHEHAFTQDRYPQLASHMTYWYDVQVKVLNLLVEYLHFKYPANNTMAQNAISTFNNRLSVQADSFLSRVESLLYVDAYYYENAGGFPYEDRLRIFCWGMFYSPILDQADLLVGQLTGVEKSLIVRLYLSEYLYYFSERLDDVTLQLRNNDTGVVYTASPATRNFQVWGGTGDLTTQVGRYVFDDIPYGNYTPVNNNHL